jgi:hypothetical protein
MLPYLWEWIRRLAIRQKRPRRLGAGSGFVAAENAEFAGSGADFGESLVEASGVGRFNVDEKLVFPGAAVDRAAFDFEQIDGVLGERLKRSKECARTMRETHGKRNLASFGGEPRAGLVFRDEKNEASKILGVVVNVFREDGTTVDFRGASGGDSCIRFVTARDHSAHAAGSVFGRDPFKVRMRKKESLALCECHRVGRHGTNIGERRTRTTDELMLDVKDDFRDHGKAAVEKKVVDANDGAGESVFDRGDKRVNGAFVDRAEGEVERCLRDGGDALAEKLDGGCFAESAGLTLKGNPHSVMVRCGHRLALSCNKGSQKAKYGPKGCCDLPSRVEHTCTAFSVRISSIHARIKKKRCGEPVK